MAAESVSVVGHMGHSSDHNGGGVVNKHETGSNASGSISRRKQQNSDGLLIARSNLEIGSAGGANNNNSKLHNGKCIFLDKSSNIKTLLVIIVIVHIALVIECSVLRSLN